MVTQLSIWKIPEKLIVTEPLTMISSPIHHLMWERKAAQEDSHLRIIGLVFSHALRFIDAPTLDSSCNHYNYGESILDTFQKAITLLFEDVNAYLKDFSIANINSKQEKGYLHQISDIREEIFMIKRVLVQQEEVWREFSLSVWPNYWINGRMVIPEKVTKEAETPEREDWHAIVRIPGQFAKYHRRIETLDEDAVRVEQDVRAKIDLMAKHATIQESHTTALMTAALFGFTIITVTFTPLSFFASLFALPIDGFQRNQVPGVFSSEIGMYRSGYVATFLATGEIILVAVTLLAIWLAVRYGMNTPVFRTLWNKLVGKTPAQNSEESKPETTQESIPQGKVYAWTTKSKTFASATKGGLLAWTTKGKFFAWATTLEKTSGPAPKDETKTETTAKEKPPGSPAEPNEATAQNTIVEPVKRARWWRRRKSKISDEENCWE